MVTNLCLFFQQQSLLFNRHSSYQEYGGFDVKLVAQNQTIHTHRYNYGTCISFDSSTLLYRLGNVVDRRDKQYNLFYFLKNRYLAWKIISRGDLCIVLCPYDLASVRTDSALSVYSFTEHLFWCLFFFILGWFCLLEAHFLNDSWRWIRKLLWIIISEWIVKKCN